MPKRSEYEIVGESKGKYVRYSLQTVASISDYGVNNMTLIKALEERIGGNLDTFSTDNINLVEGMMLSLAVLIYEIGSKWCYENVTSGYNNMTEERTSKVLIACCMKDFGIYQDYYRGLTSTRASNVNSFLNNNHAYRKYMELYMHILNNIGDSSIKIMPMYDRIIELNKTRIKFRSEFKEFSARIKKLSNEGLIIQELLIFAHKYGLDIDELKDFIFKTPINNASKKKNKANN